MNEYKKILISESPVVYYVDDLLSEEECRLIIEEAKPYMKRAGVSAMPKETQYQRDDYKGRTNDSHWIDKSRFPDICQRIANIMKCNLKCFESMQVIHYLKDQEYKYHYDAYDIKDREKYKYYCGERGNRIKTALVYLNDVEEGGETGFNMLVPNQTIKVEPKRGRLVVFHNLHYDGSLHKGSRHAGLPVKQGEKWAFNLWLREI